MTSPAGHAISSVPTSMLEPNFHAIFEAVPGLYLILKPDFTIIAASDAYLEATNTTREAIVGKGLFDVFPDNPDDPNATGVKNLTESLNNVLESRKPHTMAIQKYDIPRPASKGGGFEERHWSPLNSPVLDKHGRVVFIIHTVVDVTQFIKLKRIEEKRHKITEQLQEQNRLFQAEVEQGEKEIEEHKKNQEELRKLDTIKSEFISVASHHLRTPLTAIKWSSEALLAPSDTLTEAQQTRYLRQIHESNERMIELVGELLDVSKIDFGTFSVKPKPVRLDSSLEQVLADIGSQFRRRHITVNKIIDEDLPIIMLDPSWARIIFQNLLTNAIKYSDVGQPITITLTRQADDIFITVADRGCGIPGDQQDKIFTKFFRASNARGLVSDGSGLGLFITKAMVEQAGGKIWFESAEGKGTTFYAKLPLNNHKPQERDNHASSN